jgi:hypothetical protein
VPSQLEQVWVPHSSFHSASQAASPRRKNPAHLFDLAEEQFWERRCHANERVKGRWAT